jgi:hypothetical protein
MIGTTGISVLRMDCLSVKNDILMEEWKLINGEQTILKGGNLCENGLLTSY